MEPRDAKRRHGRVPNPVCVKHRVMLVVRSTLPTVRYLYCPEPGCRTSCCLPRRPVDETNPDVV